MSPHYLVTGGAGFIGSHIAASLVAQGFQVTVLDNLITGHESNLSGVREQIRFIKASISDPAALDEALSGVDGVFHQAAIPSVPRSIKQPLETQQSGEIGTLLLLTKAVEKNVRRIVYAGSSSVYGDTPTLPKVESMRPNPRSPYAVSKLAGESYMTAFSRCHPIDTITLRYFNIFGPRQDPNSPYSGVMAKFSTSLLAGQRPVIFGDGQQTRDFTFVDNAVDANLKAMFHPKPLGGEVINIAGGERVSLLDVLGEFNRVLGTQLEPIFEPARAGDVRDSLADLTKARELIGYHPQIPWRDGVKRLLAHLSAK
ncbi:NAD-dependent epimerase/dehydratase family protein [Oscillatoria amoena NRMC-F 0135]|nr:NAD-dependent epimerase/dehydratase family protein [Oscillatoria laete-virens]MDL5051033.1 NAD-dependent epimerase/dehydratase family protein [Oscillatoria amoena NRMC-F 0135]MDL5054484.1 NAD-dependent epimerase/dehydratase family protein [Oscillatoria laete-virens NRMC-F 0139]